MMKILNLLEIIDLVSIFRSTYFICIRVFMHSFVFLTQGGQRPLCILVFEYCVGFDSLPDIYFDYTLRLFLVVYTTIGVTYIFELRIILFSV